MIDLRRGDVVLVAFPFVRSREMPRETPRELHPGVQTKRRPAVVVQADRYNRRRAAVILAAITSSQASRELPCKVPVARDSREGQAAGLRTESIVDCQTLVTVSREDVVRRIGRFPPTVLERIDRALEDSLGLAGKPRGPAPAGS